MTEFSAVYRAGQAAKYLRMLEARQRRIYALYEDLGRVFRAMRRNGIAEGEQGELKANDALRDAQHGIEDLKRELRRISNRA